MTDPERPLAPDGRPPRLDWPIGRIIDEIPTMPYWVALRNVRGPTPYVDLAAEILGPLVRTIGGPERGVANAEMAILVSGPAAIVPVHTDDYHSVLLQAVGTKTFFVGTYPDPQVRDVEVGRRHESPKGNPHRMPDVAEQFALGPGDGSYLPPDIPHWVHGDEVSIAVSCAVYTRASQRRASARRVNVRLRQLGLRPAPIGSSRWRDDIKAGARRAWLGARRSRSVRPR